MLNRLLSLAALAAISLAAAACESTGGSWGASNDPHYKTLNQSNTVPNATDNVSRIVPANGDDGDRAMQRVADPLYPPLPSSPPVASDPGNFQTDPGTANARP